MSWIFRYIYWQKSESQQIRIWKSGTRDPRPGTHVPGHHKWDQESGIPIWTSRTGTPDPLSETQDPGTQSDQVGPGTWDLAGETQDSWIRTLMKNLLAWKFECCNKCSIHHWKTKSKQKAIKNLLSLYGPAKQSRLLKCCL